MQVDGLADAPLRFLVTLIKRCDRGYVTNKYDEDLVQLLKIRSPIPGPPAVVKALRAFASIQV